MIYELVISFLLGMFTCIIILDRMIWLKEKFGFRLTEQPPKYAGYDRRKVDRRKVRTGGRRATDNNTPTICK